MAGRRLELEGEGEKEFLKLSRKAGIWAIKIWPIGMRGFPDRMVLGPKRLIFFVELKRPKGKTPKSRALARAQEICRDRLRGLGFAVYSLHSIQEINVFFEEKIYLRN